MPQVAAPRLKRLNIDVPVLAGITSPEDEPYEPQLYEFIKEAGDIPGTIRYVGELRALHQHFVFMDRALRGQLAALTKVHGSSIFEIYKEQ